MSKLFIFCFMIAINISNVYAVECPTNLIVEQVNQALKDQSHIKVGNNSFPVNEFPPHPATSIKYIGRRHVLLSKRCE